MAAPIRPVAVLDACVLIPPGLRDLLLSCADAAVFRPVWQSQIEEEMHRNGVRLKKKRGASDEEAAAALDRVLDQMNAAFQDARLTDAAWRRHVAAMTNDPGDRHVLAAAVAADATHVVTSNMRHFPSRSRPEGVKVQPPDSFLLERLADDQDAVVVAVLTMARRHSKPAHTPLDLARKMAVGPNVPRFGGRLLEILGAR